MVLSARRVGGAVIVLLVLACLLLWLDGSRPSRSDSRATDQRQPIVHGNQARPLGAPSTTDAIVNDGCGPGGVAQAAPAPVQTNVVFLGPSRQPIPSISYQLVANDGAVRIGRANDKGIATVRTSAGFRYELIPKHRRLVAIATRFRGGQETIRVVLARPDPVTGTVKTASGAALTGCLIRERPVVPGYEPSPPAAAALQLAVRSDAHGRFKIHGCVPGQLYRVWTDDSASRVDVVAGSEVALVASPKWTVVLRRREADKLLWWDVWLDVKIHPAVLHGRKRVNGIMPEGVDAIRVPVWAGKSIVAFGDRAAGQRKVTIELPDAGGELEIIDPGPR